MNPDIFPLPTAPAEKPVSKYDYEEKALLNRKYSHAVVGFMLALASVNEDEMTVSIPELLRDLGKCSQWDAMELIRCTYKSCMRDFMTDRQEHPRDFLPSHQRPSLGYGIIGLRR